MVTNTSGLITLAVYVAAAIILMLIACFIDIDVDDNNDIWVRWK